MARVLRAEELRSLLANIFRRLGASGEHAEVTADALVTANLRCVDSHGVAAGLDLADGIRWGEVNPRPRVRVLRETEVAVLVDGDWGIGVPVAYELALRVVEKARKSGVAVGAARNIWSVGALGYYVARVAREGFVGVALANARARVSVPGARSPIVGTNPIAVAVPRGTRPIVLDMALSAVAYGRILMAARRGERIPEGWAITRDGRPTTDPREALEGYLMPAGGYKGLALAMVVDVLCSALAGAPYSLKIGGRGPYTQGGFLVAALDPGVFREHGEFAEAVEEYVQTLKSLPREPGAEIVVPGELGDRCFEERSARGIPIDDETWAKLVELAGELGIPVSAR